MIESILAIRTFKTRLAPSGMDADLAYLLGVAWETAHLVLVIALIPGALLVVAWRYLRCPAAEWWGGRVAVAMLMVPTMAWFAFVVEIALVDTILRVPDALVVMLMVGIYGLLTAAILVSTMFGKMSRAAS